MKQGLITILIALFVNSLVFSQNQNDLSIKGEVQNYSNNEIIPYVTIINKNQKNGTISNLDGKFQLSGVKNGDTIAISCIGFKKQYVVTCKSESNLIIKLQPHTELLNEVTITADNSYLYQLVTKTKKNNRTSTKTAKTYFYLESHSNNKQIELIECYYNGTYSNYNTLDLSLKNGRLAIKKFDNRIFLSTESSRTFYMHQLFTNNDYFPISPFEITKLKLRKLYSLTLEKKYKKNKSETVFVINFQPRKTDNNLFSGKVWIDSLSNNIIRVDLKTINTNMHPFLPIANVKSIDSVNLQISKIYQTIDNQQFVKSIDFSYDIRYSSYENRTFSIKTNAILYAYDYFSKFLLPKFNYSKSNYGDYRAINAIPYNSFFWENINEFELSGTRQKNDAFIKDSSSITNQKLFTNKTTNKTEIFATPYIHWSKNRLLLKISDLSKNEPLFISKLPSDRYNLEVQIYLDINKINDSINYITSTVFDPISSYYYFEIDNSDYAFINMYFDLVEIQKRAFVAGLENRTSIEDILSHYQHTISELNEQTKEFFKETERGTNKEGMLKWNTFIIDKIGIDNLKIFSLTKRE